MIRMVLGGVVGCVLGVLLVAVTGVGLVAAAAIGAGVTLLGLVVGAGWEVNR